MHGHEPVPTLDPISPEELLLKFTEIAATGDAAARRMRSRASRSVESVKALHAKQESPAVADKPVRRLRKVCTVYVIAVGLQAV